jgi:hypothetical protein
VRAWQKSPSTQWSRWRSSKGSSSSGHRVMLDRDLAELYGVPLKRLNGQVKRNWDRFPDDFMFQLTLAEGKAVQA